jgi:hypothetical protein
LLTSTETHQQTTNHNTSPSKIRHSNIIYNKLKSKSSQLNHSNRLGISYHTSYRANTQRQLFNSEKRLMYTKLYNKFTIRDTYKKKTKIKQEKRRERLKARTLKEFKINSSADEKTQVLALRRKGYLLHKNYQFYKRILHLKYHRNDIPPNINNYPYHIPYFLLSSRERKHIYSVISTTNPNTETPTPSTSKQQQQNDEIISTSSIASSPITNHSQPTIITLNNFREIDFIPIENWTPLPSNYTLPEKYLPYIPKKPLFSNSGKTYNPPGSYQWLQHIYRSAKKKKKRASEKEKAKIAYAKQCQWDAEQAVEHGTSASRFRKRWMTKSALDDFTAEFHSYGTAYNETLGKIDGTNFPLESDLNALTFLENKLSTTTYEPPNDDWEATSDDTKELEKRPRKNSSPPRILQILYTHKRPCLSFEYPEDYTEDRQKI